MKLAMVSKQFNEVIDDNKYKEESQERSCHMDIIFYKQYADLAPGLKDESKEDYYTADLSFYCMVLEN